MSEVLSPLKKNSNFGLLFCCIICLSIVVVLQLFGKSNDFAQYESIFSNTNETIEPFWMVLRLLILNKIGSFLLLIFCTTTISLFIKFYFFINSVKRLSLLVIFSYIVTFFFLHEYTQFRVSFAVAIFILSFSSIRDRRFIRYILFCLICIFIHYSCIIIIPFYFYYNIRNKKIYVILPFVLFFISVLLQPLLIHVDLLNLLVNRFNIEYISILFKMKSGHFDASLSVFNQLYLAYLFVLFISYKLSIRNKCLINENVSMCFKLLSYSLSLFYILVSFHFPVIAFRLSEFFLPFSLVLLFSGINSIREYSLYILYAMGFTFILGLKFLEKTNIL